MILNVYVRSFGSIVQKRSNQSYVAIFRLKQKSYLLLSSGRLISNKSETKDFTDNAIPHKSYIEYIAKSHAAQTLKEVENSLIRKYLKGYSRFQRRLIGAIFCAVGFGAFSLYMFREPIKENLSDEVADVASRSLGRHNLTFFKLM